MITKRDQEKIVDSIIFMATVQRACIMRGDQEGVYLIKKYFDAIDEIETKQTGKPATITSRAKSMVAGCGVSLKDSDIEKIKEVCRTETFSYKSLK